jgi:hypothetical protein
VPVRPADADARRKYFDGALRWADLAERLNVTLPPAYTGKREKRRRWHRCGHNHLGSRTLAPEADDAVGESATKT